MFLTRKSFWKIGILTGVYFLLSVVCFVAYAIFARMDFECKILIYLGVFCLFCTVLIPFIGRQGEGTSKLLNRGLKLVYQQLRPAEFIRYFEEIRDCPQNVVAKPSVDALQLLTTAYDILGDTEHAQETVDQMLLVAPPKKKAYAKLLKASLLYDKGEIQEAERYYKEALEERMDLSAKAILDVLIKSDRAMALGDYATAEGYFKQKLIQTFPKNTPLSLLICHSNLAKIYYKTDRHDLAKVHLRYCVENGGQTGIKTEAAEILSSL